MEFEIDTGASCNIIHLRTVKNNGLNHLVRNTSVQINGVRGVTHNAVGEMVAMCGYKGRTYEGTVIVLNGRKQLNLLGHSDSERLG